MISGSLDSVSPSSWGIALTFSVYDFIKSVTYRDRMHKS